MARFSEFQDLDFDEVTSFMSSAQENNADSDDLLEASLEWVSYKSSERIDCMEEFLGNIQLLECSVECLESMMESHEELLMSCPSGHKRITKTLLQMAKHDGTRKKRGTKFKNAMVAVIAGNSGEILSKVCWELYMSLQFIDLCHIPKHSSRFGVCSFPGGFILTGGESCVLCSVFVLSTKSWKH